MRQHVLDELNTIKSGHTKVKDIVHSNLKIPQRYLTSSNISNTQKSLLFNLRCKSHNEFLSNFSSSSETIPCKICLKYEDTQEHALFCEKLKQHLAIENIELMEEIKYSDLFSNESDQCRIAEVFQVIIQTREKLQATPPGLPGHSSGPRDVS